MGGGGKGGERAAALGTGVPRMAESAFWLVGQCVYVEVVQYNLNSGILYQKFPINIRVS